MSSIGFTHYRSQEARATQASHCCAVRQEQFSRTAAARWTLQVSFSMEEERESAAWHTDV